ncbi:MAG: hypothetical protein JF612_05820 [Planctomycetia bacterium]|nr:hypothetical protein [Planctomycetia bacterium]
MDHLPVLVADPDAPRAEVSVDLRRTSPRRKMATAPRSEARAAPRKTADEDPDPKLLPSSYRRW